MHRFGTSSGTAATTDKLVITGSSEGATRRLTAVMRTIESIVGRTALSMVEYVLIAVLGVPVTDLHIMGAVD